MKKIILMFLMTVLFACSNQNEPVKDRSEKKVQNFDGYVQLSQSDIQIIPSSQNKTESNIKSGDILFQYEVKNISAQTGKIQIGLAFDLAISFDNNSSTCLNYSYTKINAGESCFLNLKLNTDLTTAGIRSLIFSVLDKDQGNIYSAQYFVNMIDPNAVTSNDPGNPCKVNFHAELRKCLPNIKACSSVELSSAKASAGSKSWISGSAYELCKISNCISNYILDSVANTCSAPIIPVDKNISVKITGEGTVSGIFSDNRSINCTGPTLASECEYTINSTLNLDLTAIPAAGYKFQSWGDDCNYSLTNVCSVSVAIDKIISASFIRQFTQSGSGVYGPNGGVYAMAKQPDGKVVVVGNFTAYNSTATKYIARLNIDGSVDTSFNITGSGFSNILTSVAIQSDGKIIVGGLFSSYNSVQRGSIARLNTDGSLDLSFVPENIPSANIRKILIQADGKIIVGGSILNKIKRLLSNGNLDTNFNVGTGFFGGDVYTIVQQIDGKILVGGLFSSYNGTSTNGIVRLSREDGSIDSAFVVGSGFGGGSVEKIAVQSTGKIIVGGSFLTYKGIEISGIARLSSTGSLDTTFQLEIVASEVKNLIVDPGTDKIHVGGGYFLWNKVGLYYTSSRRNTYSRLNANGSFDVTLSYIDSDSGCHGSTTDLLIHSDGEILLSNSSYGGGGRGGTRLCRYNNLIQKSIVKIKNNGEINNNFYKGIGVDGTVNALIQQPDGKILVGGDFTRFDSNIHKSLIRLNEDGSIDNSFNIGLGFDREIKTMALQSDGKIIVSGEFSNVDGVQRIRLARLNSNGSLDTGFLVGSGLNNPAKKIIIQSDGQILIAGGFNTYQNQNARNLLRINSDGTRDITFSSGTPGFNGGGSSGIGINDMIIQPDNKIIVVGSFLKYDNINVPGIARLHSSGLLDTTFVVGSGITHPFSAYGDGYGIALFNDGRIAISGNFFYYDGIERRGLAFLNGNGSLDTSISVGTGFSDVGFLFLKKQSDDKLLIGGYFTSYNGIFKNRMIRINPDGTVDSTFTVSPVISTIPSDFTTLSNGTLLLGGDFNTSLPISYLMQISANGLLNQ